MSAERVHLSFGSRSINVALGDVEGTELRAGRRWSAVRLRHSGGRETVSGLARTDARAIVDALEAARVVWWRRALAAPIGTLGAVHNRLARLADPPAYVTEKAIRDLRREAEAAAGGFAARWPSALSNAPEIRTLRAILEFLEAPDRARAKANEAFVARVLDRCRALFDRIEARPLTEEQRRAVVVNERRNLVAAAAGSGKTSVIVAKAGWLVSRGFRRPSELLLLAFARDARKQMEERLDRRLGPSASDLMTVQAFTRIGCRAAARRASSQEPSIYTMVSWKRSWPAHPRPRGPSTHVPQAHVPPVA